MIPSGSAVRARTLTSWVVLIVPVFLIVFGIPGVARGSDRGFDGVAAGDGATESAGTRASPGGRGGGIVVADAAPPPSPGGEFNGIVIENRGAPNRGFDGLVVEEVVAPTRAGESAGGYRFNEVVVEGSDRIEDGTVLSYADIPVGEPMSGADVNAAYLRVLESGLFESVELIPTGNILRIAVSEFPIVNVVAFEGNQRVADEVLEAVVVTEPRRVYSPSVVEADADAITDAYANAGRLAATVDPKLIRRVNNRVDIVFEITEGRVVSTERISFVGNRSYSDRRLRRVLASKQAGLLRTFIRDDTFIADRIEFDRQLLTDFYQSRGYVDFTVRDITSELTRERDGFFVTFNIREGSSFNFGRVTASSGIDEVAPEDFLAVSTIGEGRTYSPVVVDDSIERMERLALQKGLNFIRVEPRITRNDADLTLDVDFEIIRGPRVFIERIDIKGNTTTLDRVIRNQFRVVEGDPFNPREIRRAAERIRALNYFKSTDVAAREGTDGRDVIIDVDVEETPTGNLAFGGNYSTDSGFGLAASFNERNFLGRGQHLGVTLSFGTDVTTYELYFAEPNFLGRDLRAELSLFYSESNALSSSYSATFGSLQPGLAFPVSENGRLRVAAGTDYKRLYNVSPGSSRIIFEEESERFYTTLGYGFTYDNRRSGLDPDSGFRFRFDQDLFNGEAIYVKSEANFLAETLVFNEELTLRGNLRGGAVTSVSGQTTILDRFNVSARTLRGFQSYSIGPRDLLAPNRNVLGGNYLAVARAEAQFPIGIPDEYGVTGGLFLDAGSVWGLDNKDGGPRPVPGLPDAGGGPVDDGFKLRSAAGFSIFWKTQIGPLRFNFNRPLVWEEHDRRRFFDFTVSTSF